MTEKRNNDLNVPTLRFPGFDGEWTTVRLGDLVNIQSGFAFKSEGFTDNGIKLVIPKNFTKHGFGNFDHSISKFSNELPPPNYKCRAGDLLILLTDLTPSCELLGKPLLIKEEDGEVWLNQRIIRLDTNSTLSKRWLLYFLQTNGYHKVIKETATGSTVRHSSNKIINDMILSLPTIEEQEKISSVLQSIDDRILTQNKIIEELKLLKSTLCNLFFQKKIRFRDEKGNSFPDWVNIKMSDILTEVNEKSTRNNQFKILSSTAKGLFNQDQYFKREIASKDNIGYKILQRNQLVFSPQNLWMGNINVNIDFENGIVSPSYKIFSFKPNTSSIYCHYFLKQPELMYEYEQASVQGASIVRRNLEMDKFLNIKITLPSIEEQTRISKFISSIDQKLILEIKFSSTLIKQKQNLLYQLFK